MDADAQDDHMCAAGVKEESSSDEEFRNGIGNALKHNLKIEALPVVDGLVDVTPDGIPIFSSRKLKARKEKKNKQGRKSGSTKDTSHAMDVFDSTTIPQHDGPNRGGSRKLKIMNEYTSDESSLFQSSPKRSPKMTFSSE